MALEETILEEAIKYRPNALHLDDRIPAYTRTHKDYAFAREIAALLEKHGFESYTL